MKSILHQCRRVFTMSRVLLSSMSLALLFALVMTSVLVVSNSVFAAPAVQCPVPGQCTTLAAYKTIDICLISDSLWRYSGEISVWNEGKVDTVGFNLTDNIQSKVSGPVWTDSGYSLTITPPAGFSGQIPAGTTLDTATVFKYSIDAAPLSGDIRNVAKATILNHSSSYGTAFGPEPKATYVGTVPPKECPVSCGCSYSYGYWKKHTDIWPAGFDPNTLFFSSGQTWLAVLNTPVRGNNYYNLAHQYIGAALNQANGACAPQGIFGMGGAFTDATTFFQSGATPSTCAVPGSCGAQNTQAGILESYNTGNYPNGPAHCADDDGIGP